MWKFRAKSLVFYIAYILLTVNSLFAQHIRKEWSEMTLNESTDYLNALSLLDDAFDDDMTLDHRNGNGIHTTPQFLPWHRLFLLEMENRLRATGYPNLTIPYWNWYNEWSQNSDLFRDGYKREEHILNV